MARVEVRVILEKFVRHKPIEPESALSEALAKVLSTQETKIGDLLPNSAAKAVLDRHLPGMSDDTQIAMASGMTLRAVQVSAAYESSV